MPNKQYPYPCCRCGFCCLSEQCPVSIIKFGNKDFCPVLTFNNTEAICGLPELITFGEGCCMKARCYARGQCYFFASLKKEVKISIAQFLKNKKEE